MLAKRFMSILPDFDTEAGMYELFNRLRTPNPLFISRELADLIVADGGPYFPGYSDGDDVYS